MKRPWFFVLLGGLVAGTFDITYASIFWYLKRAVLPTRVFQSVASGLVGDGSFTGGWRTALLGLMLHYFIAISMAITYYLVARRWSELWQKPWTYGPLYGVLLYGIMNYIVVPLSAANPGSRNLVWVVLSIIVHAFLIGTPCALFARRAMVASRLRVEQVPELLAAIGSRIGVLAQELHPGLLNARIPLGCFDEIEEPDERLIEPIGECLVGDPAVGGERLVGLGE